MFVIFCCRSPANVRGIFKIPQLNTQHFNMDVYSQVDDRNDNSYEEVNVFTCYKGVALLHKIYFRKTIVLFLISIGYYIGSKTKLLLFIFEFLM